MVPWTFPLVTAGALLAAAASLACAGGDAPASRSDGPPSATEASSLATIEAPPPPRSVVPVPAAQGGRPDCPQGWAAYEDPDGYFSLCYPADWLATAGAPQALFGTTITLRSPPPGSGSSAVLLTGYWSRAEPGEPTDGCNPATGWRNVQEVGLALAGRTAAACTGDVVDIEDPSGSPPVRGTYAVLPGAPRRGHLVVFLFEAQGGAGGGPAVLETLRLEP